MRNPNNQNGVELHLDLGVAPLDSADERKFGNWKYWRCAWFSTEFYYRMLGTS